MAGAPQQLGGLSIAGRLIHGVAVGDQGIHTKVAVLALQGTDIVVVQSLENRPAVSVAVLHQVAGSVLNGVLSGCRTGGDVIPGSLNSALGLAAAGGELGSQSVEALLGLVAKLAHSGVNPMEAIVDGIGQSVGAVTDAILDGVDAGLEVVQRKTLIDVRTGCPRLEAGAIHAVGATAKAVAPAAAKGSPDKE